MNPSVSSDLARLDRYDKAILRLLQSNARISNRALSDAVSLSPSTVFERVKRLSKSGFILGFQTRLNPEKIGSGQIAFVQVTLERTRKDALSAMRAAIGSRPEILDCYAMAGEFDFLLRVCAPDMPACREIVSSALRTLLSIKEIRTYAVMSHLKESTELPI